MIDETIERVRFICVKGGVRPEIMGALCHYLREALSSNAAPQDRSNPPAQAAIQDADPAVAAPRSETTASADVFAQNLDCHYDGDIDRCDKDCKHLGECKRRTTGDKHVEGHDWKPDGGVLRFESHPGGEAPHVHTTCAKCGARAWFLEYQWELLAKGCA